MVIDLETLMTLRREQVERDVHSARSTGPVPNRPATRPHRGADAWRDLPGYRRHVVDE